MEPKKTTGKISSFEAEIGHLMASQSSHNATYIPNINVSENQKNFVMVINQQREIIYANEALRNHFGSDDLDDIQGLKPGNALGCVYALESTGGCGTTEHCHVCGILKASSPGLKVPANDKLEVSLMKEKIDESLNLNILTSTVIVNGEKFIVLTAIDTSDEKRHRALERIFFHDVLNTASGIKSLLDMLMEANGAEEKSEYLDLLPSAVTRLIEEIRSQRDLSAAESNELQPNYSMVSALEIINNVTNLYRNHFVAKDKTIEIDKNCYSMEFTNDKVLIGRVIGNMLKNALEASENNEIVWIGCREKEGHIEFFVHNNSYMPKEVQLQIFHRAFSTKGSDRGLGTYSMNLLCNKYLNGDVSFKSLPKEGTTFFVKFPL
ncbi:MAG: HAMP domain-containing sensor histidine kinase [Ignavibacteria bacterium]